VSTSTRRASGKRVSSVTFAIDALAGGSLAYAASDNAESSIVVSKP
jgi:hypothetical protein